MLDDIVGKADTERSTQGNNGGCEQLSDRIIQPEQAKDSFFETDYEKEVKAPFTDGLTGLFNHGFFQTRLDHELKRSERYGGLFTLGLIDIDWFSRFNQRHGFLEGDRRLKEIGTLIAADLQGDDVAARFSGDIFAVLFTMSEVQRVETAAERIRSAIEKAMAGKLTVSLGLASHYPEATPGRLIYRARQALAQAKNRGKNRVFMFAEAEPLAHNTEPRVLVVDDDPVNLKVFEAMLRRLNYEVVKASQGEEALQAVQKTEIDLILLDVMMPDMDGYEVCRQLKANDATRMIPIIMLTALSGTEAKVKGIEAGADDFITKPPNKMELLARTKSLIQVKGLNDNLTSIEDVLLSLANAIEARDSYTEGHVQRVAQMALALGRRMSLPDRDMKALRLGGVLHDIGKIKVPDDVLNKPGPLTAEERAVMETHALAGYQMCLPLTKTLGAALDVIRWHHEKLDGSGYPDGIKGNEIPLAARIMAVVDIYDALVTDRPYRRGVEKKEGLRILMEMVAEGQLDNEVVGKFMEIIE